MPDIEGDALKKLHERLEELRARLEELGVEEVKRMLVIDRFPTGDYLPIAKWLREKEVSAAKLEPSPPPAVQRRGRKRRDIRERMVKWVHSGKTWDELDRLPQEDLVTLFGGRVGESRQIYCRARDEALMDAGFVRSTKST
jgi:hypothetical protein